MEGLLQPLDGPHVLEAALRVRPQQVEAPAAGGVKAGVQGLAGVAPGGQPVPAQPDDHPLIGLRGVDDGPVNQIVLDQQDVPGLEEVGDALHQIGRFSPQEEDELVEFVIVIVHLLGPAVLQMEEAEVLVEVTPFAGGFSNEHGAVPPFPVCDLYPSALFALPQPEYPTNLEKDFPHLWRKRQKHGLWKRKIWAHGILEICYSYV